MELLAIGGTILGIVGLAGGVVGYFSKSKGDAIIAYQAREIELRDGTITRLEKENAACSSERDSLKEQNDKLWSKATGTPQLIDFTKELKNQIQAFNSLADSISKLLKIEGSQK